MKVTIQSTKMSDQFCILVDGTIVHTVQTDMSREEAEEYYQLFPILLRFYDGHPTDADLEIQHHIKTKLLQQKAANVYPVR